MKNQWEKGLKKPLKRYSNHNSFYLDDEGMRILCGGLKRLDYLQSINLDFARYNKFLILVC